MFSKKDKNKKSTEEKIDAALPKEYGEIKSKEKIEKTKSKEEENLEGWKRCQADFDNYRKRQDERMKELGNIVREDMALQILPVVDNFQMSLDHVPVDQGKSPWIQGILHIQRQLETILRDNGIAEIETKEGDVFKPEIHEAVENHQEGEKEGEHRVKKIISKGYKIGDKVMRAVKVIVE